MKKILTIALCVTSIGMMGAKNLELEQAKKLSGKVDKIVEARELVKKAIESPDGNNVETYFIAGKIEFDAYNKLLEKLRINPKDPEADPVAMADMLLNGYQYFQKALPLDSLPDEKGKINPKNSKKIFNTIKDIRQKYYDAGATYFNNKKLHPEAYNAFMIFGDVSQDPRYVDAIHPAEPDSIVALAYMNAGKAGWFGNNVSDAFKAFEKARMKHLNDPDLYVFEIASLQHIAKNDSTKIDECQEQIFNISKEGYETFGIKNPLFINNYSVILIQKERNDEAINILTKEINNNPDNAMLIGLRAYIYDKLKNDDKAIEDYKKAASIQNADFETLLNAGKKVFRIGTQKWNLIEGNSAEARAAREDIKVNYFEAAKAIADKAKDLNPDNSQLQNLLESINYVLETYFPKAN